MKLKSILSVVGDRSRSRRACPGLAAMVPVALLFASAALGDDTPPGQEQPAEIRLQHGRFDPAELIVPANTAFKIRVTNGDPEAIEFESFELHRERVVKPGETITVFMPSLSPGTYKFFDDFHSDTPNGAIVVK
jgi:hypothetical protein